MNFKLVFTSILTIITSLSAFSQQNPEDYSPWMRKGKGTLVLNSGEKITGYGRFHILHDYVDFFKEFDDKEKTYKVSDIQSFSINDSLFFSKLTKGAELSMSKKKTFVFLKNNTDSKFKLYERSIIESDLSVAGALGLTDRLTRDYFVELPDDAVAVHSITGLKFMPFAKKVSALVGDCPSLAQKISEKQEGYFSSFGPKLSTNVKQMIEKNQANRPESVWLKIFAEYEGCQKL